MKSLLLSAIVCLLVVPCGGRPEPVTVAEPTEVLGSVPGHLGRWGQGDSMQDEAGSHGQ